MSKRIELPVAEDMQLGMSIGLAMTGKVVISIFPRMDFLMCCMNQIVNHLDKGIYPGKVIIRTCVGSTKPMNPGSQHCGDYTDGLRRILKNTLVYQLVSTSETLRSYQYVYRIKENALVVEYGDFYGMES
jgi:transketolase C-terminal domain/subunit